VDLSSRNQQLDVLKSQAQQGQHMLDTVVQAGVAPSAGSLRAAVNPLQSALAFAMQSVKSGQLPQSAVPTPRQAAPTYSQTLPPPAQSGPSVPPPSMLQTENY
jgi:hypothetical protein